MANLLSQNEIEVLMGAISGGDVPAMRPSRQTVGPVAVQPPKNVRSYDFRHPVIFLRDQLRTLQVIHETFARSLAYSLSSHLRTTVQVKCISVDQMSYREFLQGLPDPCTVIRIGVKPADGRTLMTIHPAIGSGALDRLAGGPGMPDTANRPFTEIELSMLEEFMAISVRELDPAWNRGLKISFNMESIEANAEFVQIAMNEETVAVVTLEVNFGQTQGILCMCYPFRVLTAFKEKLSARHWVEEEKGETAAKTRQTMEFAVNQIPLRMTALLGTANITMQDLAQIKAGDVLPLTRDIRSTVEIMVDGETRFKGHLGAYHGKKAVLVQERVSI